MKKFNIENEREEWKIFVLSGYLLIFVTFFIFGLWAAVAKVDKAVVASGWVSVESNKKTVQHLEGGIVKEILIKEGQHVSKGQPLIYLESTQASANADIMTNQVMTALAIEARLLAERDNSPTISWPAEFLDSGNSPSLRKLVEDEERQFAQRRETLNGQLNIIASEIEGINIEKEATNRQVKYLEEELRGLRVLQQKKLVSTNRVLTMERERTRLEGIIGKTISEIARLKIQSEQIKQKFKEDVATQLLDIRNKLADSRQRKVVAADILRRITISSPKTGTVQNLKAFTIGQVIRGGEPILDIVPDDESLVINAQFMPQDIDIVHDGQVAEIRFPAFHSRTIPTMEGKIETLSRDRMIDEASRQPYFLGTISINKADIPSEFRSRIRSGMPAEIIIAAGERTVLNYLISPLSSALRKTFIEQ